MHPSADQGNVSEGTPTARSLYSTQSESVMVVTPTLPVKSIRELIAYAKANPGKLNYGTTSVGAAGHLGVEQFKSIADVRIEFIPYVNIGNLVNDLLSGRLSVFIAPPVSVLAHIQSGKLRAMGVTGNKRLALLPDVPPIIETLPEFRAMNSYGVMAPARTPPDIIAKVNSDARWVLDQADVRQRIAQTGVDATSSTPEEMRSQMLREIEIIDKLVKSGAIKRQQ